MPTGNPLLVLGKSFQVQLVGGGVTTHLKVTPCLDSVASIVNSLTHHCEFLWSQFVIKTMGREVYVAFAMKEFRNTLTSAWKTANIV